ncbi:MAG: 30S ribosomal protein S12 methylthiotransferase RimO [Synergistaceae bacterium]|jgi:ribosomal protein S12 methylthiotransferase|nr:30S ribosomal protein S12 methylthiotransferase RimO [Synergistaceae bacterium]
MKLLLISMGCAKNGTDSERLAAMLKEAGHALAAPEEKQADAAILNTCGFIQDAVKENVDAILDLEAMKERGDVKKIVVIGCLVNRYEAELRAEIPSVDLWARVGEWGSVIKFLADEAHDTPPAGGTPSLLRVLLPGAAPWSRSLKVSEGCGAACSYCTIPAIRGPLVSVPIGVLIAEAKSLAADGAKEICMVAQDITDYGRDMYGQPEAASLIRRLSAALDPDMWLRVMYANPDGITPEFLDALLESENVPRYLDMPIQHIDDEILAAMNRGSSAGIRSVISRLRAADPSFAIRTTLMVGFPGETEEKFRALLDFIEEAELDRVGVFPYSPEEGTASAQQAAGTPVPDEVKAERVCRLMEAQASISRRRGSAMIGRTLKVLVEDEDDSGSSPSGTAWGRSYRDAPEVDGLVCISISAGVAARGERVRVGEFAKVKIDDAEDHDLFGTLAF